MRGNHFMLDLPAYISHFVTNRNMTAEAAEKQFEDERGNPDSRWEKDRTVLCCRNTWYSPYISQLCLNCVPNMSHLCPNCVPIVSQLCPNCVPIVSQ